VRAKKLIREASQLEQHRARNRTQALQADARDLAKALDVAERRADLVEAFTASARKPLVVKRKASPHNAKRVATPVLLASDWHVGERVTLGQTNGRNLYNPQIAEASARRLAEALCWMIEHHRTSFEIREVVIWPGGDLITGYLHDDQRQSNHLPPVKEVLLVQDLLGNLIDQVLGMPGIERVIVPCSYGNHGRTTAKPQVSTGAENSFEWLLYHQMRRTYEAARRPVEWQIPDGEFNYLRVHGTTIRFTHGDAAKYGGGVGGITIPINKAIARWQTHTHADVTCMGHFHTYHDLPNLVVNGSLIGASPYGMRVGGYETPAQAFFLIDAKRGKCQSTPLWVREGRT
jgi:hypothetical protein